jgi:hypothetical protein
MSFMKIQVQEMHIAERPYTFRRLEPTIYSTRGEHANLYPSGAIDIFYFIYNYSDDNTVAYAGYDLYKLISTLENDSLTPTANR